MYISANYVSIVRAFVIFGEMDFYLPLLPI
jgi:hypothetical protein